MTVIDYNVTYVDKQGVTHTFSLMSTDVRTAMNNAFELRPEIKRIVRCIQAPMFDD